MKDINSVTLVGRLVRDPELRYTNGGMAVLGFDIAVNRSVKHGDQWKNEANFFNCVLFGKMGEAVSKYMAKGKQVCIIGELTQDRWEKDGQKHSKVKIICSSLQLLGDKQQNNQQNSYNHQAPAPKKEESSGPEDFEDDIPF